MTNEAHNGDPTPPSEDPCDHAYEHLAKLLRAALCSMHHGSTDYEAKEGEGRSPLEHIRTLDTGAFIAWCLAGLPLFSAPGGVPTMRHAQTTTRRLVIALAMLDCDGDVRRAAKRLKMSRRALREDLERFDMHRWPKPPRSPL